METITIKDNKNLKTSEIFAQAKEKFPCWSYLSDEELDKNFPAPKEDTERAFRESVEPDTETLGKSTKEADPYMKGITLRERILLEIAYFDKTGRHLDIKGITFCSGSRYSGGSVPYAYWSNGDGFRVDWCNLDDSYSFCGIRSEVLPSSSSLVSFDEALKIVKANGCKVTRLETKEVEL